MMTQTSMSLAQDLSTCLFSPPSMISLPWLQPSPPETPVKLYSPHVPYTHAQTNLPHSPSVQHQQQQSHPQPPQQPHPLASKKKGSRKLSKSSYKHIPHKDKPPHLVARRNARERRRVQAVNSAFARLRKCVPVENRSKRLSKVKTLHRAIEYINNLQSMLSQAVADTYAGGNNSISSREQQEDFREIGDYLESDVEVVNKENEAGQRWIALDTACEQSSYGPYISYYEDYSGSLTS